MLQILAEPVARSAKKKVRSKGRILLVDDNKELSSVLKEYLEKESYEVLYAKDGEEGLALTRKHKPELVILDVIMPKLDGMGFLKALRQESQIPVLVVTGKHSDINQVLGFKLGADDFVFKPFCAEVLIARIEAILKRSSASNGSGSKDDKSLKRLGTVTVDPERREVRVGGNRAELTIKEFDLLNALINARGKVLSRDQLLSTVWGIGEDCDIRTRTVDQHIAGLRQKLGAEGERIMTVPHFGYRIKIV